MCIPLRPSKGFYSLGYAVGYAADTICKNGPLAVRACKESAKRSTFLDLKAALDHEMTYSSKVFMSEDAKEGIKAFAEKRPPVWKGR